LKDKRFLFHKVHKRKCRKKKREENHMKKFTAAILSAILAAAMAGCSGSTAPAADQSSDQSAETAEKTVYKVAVVKQLDHASLDEIANAITAEFDRLAAAEGVTIEYKVYSGNNDASTLQSIGSDALVSGVDAFVPIATLAAQTMYVAAEDTKTPVIFAAISDPEGSQLTDIDFVTGTSDALNTEQLMEMIVAENPDVKKVALLYSPSESNSEKPVAEAKAYLDSKNIPYEDFGSPTNRDEVIQTASSIIASGCDVVFTPTDNVIMDAELTIAPLFAEANIRHYAGADSFVRNGAFATAGVNYTDLGTETADLAYDVLVNGIENTKYYKSYEVMPGGIITVNTETAALLGADCSVFSQFGKIVEVQTTEN
jgi:putative ABC transport system substrate-binding protein